MALAAKAGVRAEHQVFKFSPEGKLLMTLGVETGSGPEVVTADRYGNVFGGEPRPRVLRKYVKVRRHVEVRRLDLGPYPDER